MIANNELEKKLAELTRELDIQASLEKARGIALAMKKPGDMPDVCRVISQQLESLGVIEIRNVQTAIFYAEKGTYMNYEFYAKHDKTFITEVNYTDHEIARSFAEQMMKGNGQIFITHLKGKEVEEWLNYQKGTNVFIDALLETATSLNYYWYSLGPVALGISTYASFNENEIELFKRFRNVFDLAYRRYLDIEKAEAQAREAQIQLALERVRARTMAMQKSSELSETAYVLFQQFKQLGEVPTQITIGIFNEQERTIEFRITGANGTGNKIEQAFSLSIEEPTLLRKMYAGWKEQKKSIVIDLAGQELLNWIKHRTEMSGITDSDTEIDAGDRRFICAAFFSKGLLTFSSISSISGETILLLERFAAVFDQTYTRFLDLEKAEAQAREAQIETALEKVRSRSLAMHSSDELSEVVGVVFDKLRELDFGLEKAAVLILIFSESSKDHIQWAADPNGAIARPFRVPFSEHSVSQDIYNAKQSGLGYFSKTYSFEEKNNYFQYLFEHSDYQYLPDDVRQMLLESTSYGISVAFEKKSAIDIASNIGRLLSEEEKEILQRFVKVFEQAYIRFLDLQKVEAQAREAQIEAALERVRSRTMAMHQTSELQEVIHKVHQELLNLQLSIDGGSFVVINKDIEKELKCWGSGGTADTSEEVVVPDFNMPFCTNLISGIKKGSGFFTEEFSQQEKKAYFTKLFEHEPWSNLSGEQKQETLANPGGYTRSVAVSNHTAIFIINHQGRKFSEDENDILRRFAKVFEQTYARFLDLQKAEAQAREAQIQLGLERVRARAMAMLKSDELKELIGTVFTELTKLDLVLTRCVIMIYDIKTLGITWWMANSEDPSNPMGLFVKYHQLPPHLAYIKAWEDKELKWQYVLEGKIKKEWDDFLFLETELSHLPDFVIAGMKAPERVYLNSSFNSFGNLTLATLEPLSDEHADILLRFAKVFDLTYTRFNDLKQAEAQAREAQIELGLERVRARAMAMQKSDELKELITTVYTELGKLDFLLNRADIEIYDPKTKDSMWWMFHPESSEPIGLLVKYHELPPYLAHVKGWENRETKWLYILEGEVKKTWDEFIFTQTELCKLPKLVITNMRSVERAFIYASFNNFGCLSIATLEPITDEQFDILLRFAKVFDLTYTRFNDLKQAEAQAREAQIQLALERVRARTMAMQKSEELNDTAVLLFRQVADLGIRTWTTGFNVWSDDGNAWLDYVTNPEGGFIEPYLIDATKYPFNEVSEAKKRGDEFLVRCEEGEKLAETYRQLTEFGEKQYKAIQDIGFAFPSKQYEHFVFGSRVSLMFITYELVPEAHDIFKRFGKVFEQTYTRFLDLQKAEAQAREAKIEAALERVRSRAMAMQKSDELKELIGTVSAELGKLDLILDRGFIMIFDAETNGSTWWIANPEMPLEPISAIVRYHEHPYYLAHLTEWKKRTTRWQFIIEGENKKTWDEFLLTKTELAKFPEPVKANMKIYDKLYLSESFNNFGCLSVASREPLSEEQFDILIRFAKVFDLTYTRLQDLKQAEVQAREAQIETALERVRSRSMAMHKSDELLEVINVVSEQLQQLHIRFGFVTFGVTSQNEELDFWLASPGFPRPERIHMPAINNPITTTVVEGQKKELRFFSNVFSAEVTRQWIQVLCDHNPTSQIMMQSKDVIMNGPGFARSAVLLKDINVFIGNFAMKPLSDEQNAIVIRFANVFEQSYIRFLDLQQAEAQAREAEIELALERVRARTMAMQHSEELQEVVHTVLERLKELNVEFYTAIIVLFTEGSKDIIWWLENKENQQYPKILIPYADIAYWRDLFTVRENGINHFSKSYSSKEKDELYHHLFEHTDFKYVPENQKKFLLEAESATFSVAIAKNSGIHLTRYSGKAFSESDNDILKRFANVFEQSYTRFLDLQKAEAQAREAQIEASLERVRGKAMAMHNSNDVSAAASMVFTELRKLGIDPIRCGVGLLNKETVKAQLYSATSSAGGDSLSLVGWVQLENHPVLEKIYESWVQQKDYYPELTGEQLESYYKNLLAGLSLPTVPNWQTGEKQYGHFFSFSVGCLYAWSDRHYNESEIKILKRFATIIDLTFRRFLDLKKAEAQAKESQIETALEKVRSRTLAMQKSDELADTSAVLFKQLIHLGIAPNRLYIGIIHDNSGEIEFWITDEDGSKVSSKFTGNALYNPSIKKMYDGWAEQKKWQVIDMHGKELREYFHYLGEELRVPFKGGLSQKRRIQYLAYFSKGFIGMASPDEQPNETINLLERFAYVFNLTFTRFNDLQIAEAHALQAEQDLIEIKAARKRAEDTLTELRQTQKQLIQSEKMASLGELTAGIAHEIQNPLNFVNNFSDVSNELFDEMNEELNKGDIEEAKLIATDIKHNLEKINHHGKRADAIVKGMLQHSRSSKGVKEPTDINALCDEYLRLSYHGLRAKDKSFNAEIKKDLDESIGKISIVPQDIGRVLLNLFNNAFYAVTEKRIQVVNKEKSGISDEYRPTVFVSTKKAENSVFITVSDNGNGIPQKILDKIFQPFFTTKPTGSGTGLGLSLSYDIVKAHGGEIKVESKEGEESKFIIKLTI